MQKCLTARSFGSNRKTEQSFETCRVAKRLWNKYIQNVHLVGLFIEFLYRLHADVPRLLGYVEFLIGFFPPEFGVWRLLRIFGIYQATKCLMSKVQCMCCYPNRAWYAPSVLVDECIALEELAISEYLTAVLRQNSVMWRCCTAWLKATIFRV